MTIYPIQITTTDKYPLKAYAFKAQKPIAKVLIGCAMGTPQSFYRPFAKWLCDQGYDVLTFDYRGMFESGGSNGPRTEASFELWGKQDLSAAAQHLWKDEDEGFELKKIYIGHSLGAQLFTSCHLKNRFDLFLSVAIGNGYWPKLKTFKAKIGLFAVTQLWGPLLTPILGYFPGRRLKKVGDLPAGVIKQWSKWCAQAKYHLVDNSQVKLAADLSLPIVMFYSNDDDVFTRNNILFFFESFGSQQKRLVEIEANTYQSFIGHHGYFKPRFRETLWPEIMRLL